ncbi:MAG: hypothetical protein AAGA32_13755 [Pseudomonadota bacterium]
MRWVFLLPLVLLACGEEETFTFASEKERQCFLQAEAAITSPDTRLERGRGGAFVEVTSINGFVRDVDVSETFRNCMAIPDGGISTAVVTETAPVTFTPEERSIWNGLSDAEKRSALIFIQQGGTLLDFVGQG